MDTSTDTSDQALQRADKREAEARARLEDPAKGQQLDRLLQFFCEAHLADPKEVEQLLPSFLQDVLDLQLMYLSEHRAGVAGGIVGILHLLYPDLDRPDDYLPVDKLGITALAQGSHLPLIQSAIRLTPSARNEDITMPVQVEFLWMAWAVLQRPAILARLSTLALRQNAVGDAAYLCLYNNASHPEVQATLLRLLTERQQAIIAGNVNQKQRMDVGALRLLISADPVWKRQLISVGWYPHEDKGQFVVVTVDGGRPPCCPTEWRGSPVIVRKPTKAEIELDAKLRKSREDV